MPTYTAGVDFISSTDECRRLARRIVNADFSDDQIKSWQYKYYSYIRTLTDKDGRPISKICNEDGSKP